MTPWPQRCGMRDRAGPIKLTLGRAPGAGICFGSQRSCTCALCAQTKDSVHYFEVPIPSFCSLQALDLLISAFGSFTSLAQHPSTQTLQILEK